MSILTLEIWGEPVVCICAEDRAAVENIVQQSWFHRELTSHHSRGAPLWDGSAEFSLRPSTRGEAEIVEERFEAHKLTGDPQQAENGAIVFLVPVESVGGRDAIGRDDDFPI
jgi:hypothetical protein